MMIVQSILFFILGGAVAAFIMVLFAPFVWQRAVYLARKAVHSEMPLSLMEVEADRDFLRVQHAVSLSQVEQKLESERETHVERRLELDHANEKLHDLADIEVLYQDLDSQLDASEKLVAQLKHDLANREREVEHLSGLEPHNAQLKKQMREQERKIVRLEKQNEKLKQRPAGSGKADRNVVKSVRKEIRELAANVAADVAKSEGRASPVRKLTEKNNKNSPLAAAIRKKMRKN